MVDALYRKSGGTIKKSLALLLLMFLLHNPSPANGQDVAGRNIDTVLDQQTLTWGLPYGAPEAGADDFDIQSMLGSNRKAHFRLNELFALEFDLDGLPGFTDEDEDILTNMVVTKISPHLGPGFSGRMSVSASGSCTFTKIPCRI